MGTLKVVFVQSYGVTRCYVEDPVQGDLLERLTGTKTLSPHQRDALEELGFDIVGHVALQRPDWSR